MKQTLKVTAEQMRSRIFRFSERRLHVNHAGDSTIPEEVLAAVNPPIYLLMTHVAPGTPEGMGPAIAGARGLQVALIELPPGRKAPLHVHFRSREAFVCLRGRVRFCWGDEGADETILGPFDMIDFPVGVCRDFQTADDETALMLGIITDEQEDEPGDIFIAPGERARFAERFGAAILEQLTAATGLYFTDPVDE